MKKTKNIIIKMILIILLILAIAILIGWTYHNVYLNNKIGKIKEKSEFVSIDDKKLHVFKTGSGEKTVVLLSGHGVSLPYADFGPLIRELEEDYTVAVVEYFGVGLSDMTKNDRDNEEMVREIREGLKGVGLDGPYILVPNSISYVYSEYYAKTYPEEVEGIFVLDGTVPVKEKIIEVDEAMNGDINIMKVMKKQGFMQKIGFQDLIFKYIVKTNKLEDYSIPYTIQNGYTQEEIDNLMIFVSRNVNNNMLRQLEMLGPNILNLLDLPLEMETPVFRVIASESNEKEMAIKQLKSLNQDNDYVVIEGSHFIYQKNEVKMKELLDKFIIDINKTDI